jgi:pimeloyl-ACP methyl ester carboxylesterase
LTNSKSESVQVDGLSVRFQHAGSGPAMVLVHGLLAYSFSWRFALPHFAHEREVFALDMPGSGLSDLDRTLDGTVEAAAGRLARFMDAVGIRNCDLIGSSFGGTTSLMLATQQPDRLRTLTLISPANPWSRIGRKRLLLLKISILGSLFPRVARAFHPLSGYFLRRMYGDPHAVTEEAIRGYSLPLGRPGVLEHGVKIAQAWTASMAQLEQALPAAAGIPTLLIWGSKDRLVERASVEILQQKLDAMLTIMPGAGHLPYEEYSGEFCQDVLKFLAEHPGRLPGGK